MHRRPQPNERIRAIGLELKTHSHRGGHVDIAESDRPSLWDHRLPWHAANGRPGDTKNQPAAEVRPNRKKRSTSAHAIKPPSGNARLAEVQGANRKGSLPRRSSSSEGARPHKTVLKDVLCAGRDLLAARSFPVCPVDRLTLATQATTEPFATSSIQISSG